MSQYKTNKENILKKENQPKTNTTNKTNTIKTTNNKDQQEDKSLWFSKVMNNHPELKNLRERVVPVSRAESFGRIFGVGKEETKKKLTKITITQLIMQHLMVNGLREQMKILEKESNIKYQPRYLRESRLQELIRIAIKNVDFVWNQTFKEENNNLKKNASSGISLIDHFHSLGLQEKDDDENELVNIWDDESTDNIIYKESDNNNEKEETKQIQAASLNKLVELLTHEKGRNVNDTKTFVMTYQSFTTPKILLTKLIQRFHIPQKYEKILKNKKKLIQFRVCNFLKFWITDYFEDFQPKLLPELIDFIDNSIRKADMTKMAQNLKENIERKMKEMNETKKFNFSQPPPDPILPKNVFSPKLSLFDVDEEEIARQLTLLEFDIYSKIKPSELLKLAWSKPKLRHKAPNVIKMIQSFNTLSVWTATVILQHDRVKDRGKIITKLIKIADYFRELNNFNGLMSILSGLGSSGIHRLKHSFNEVPSRYLDDYFELETDLSSEKSYSHYRKLIVQTIPPCIPYFALCLTDLTFLEDGNKDMIGDLINFSKRKLIYDLINDIQKYQPSGYNFHPVHQIVCLLENLPNMDESELYTRSLKVEPRDSKREDLL
ncbi:ras guanine nucleotide exchange factor i-related [Anaeramoeba flamelloides]|uniref:Ras guanine nucleotide exchange factor i-related n=1 Tax=Anaeramoeba flamelloides TaxID=1746091 RepID=A0ABQ8YY95_9EUKA|nr:ras guanine nucleotide exchange factor i-related [Anaeramoeba flamelloides]